MLNPTSLNNLNGFSGLPGLTSPAFQAPVAGNAGTLIPPTETNPFSLGQSPLNPALPAGDLTPNNPGLFNMVQLITQLVTMMFSSLGGNPAAVPGTPLGGGSPAFDRAAAAMTGNAGGANNTTKNPAQANRLNSALSKVAKDPEGSVLLEKAKANGFNIRVAEPGELDNTTNGLTTNDGPGNREVVINPNAPDFDKTLVHELVHAATINDDNSQDEEGIADVIGYRVSSRMDGQALPGNAQQIHDNKAALYGELQGSNGVRASLAALGLNPGV